MVTCKTRKRLRHEKAMTDLAGPYLAGPYLAGPYLAGPYQQVKKRQRRICNL